MSIEADHVTAEPATDDVGAKLTDVAEALEGFRFRLPSPGLAERERERSELVRSVRDHLLPRLADHDAPLVAGFFGAGGAGKSLVVNSLAQRNIGIPGPVRPTTRAAVIWAHRDHAARYWREFLVQVQERVGPAVETIVGDDPLTGNLTLIDTPSFDLVSPEGTRIAHDVLAIADLCVFVASAKRYADSASWEFLRLVQRRGVPILFVLNRLPENPTGRAAIVEDYARRLAADGLLLEPDPGLIFAISQQLPESHGGVAGPGVAALRRELEELADREFRSFVSSQAVRGAITDLTGRARPLVEALTAEAATAGALLGPVAAAYGEARGGLRDALRDGGAGAGDEHSRQRVARIVTHLAGTAAQQSASAWDQHPVGRKMLEGDGRALWRHGQDAMHRTEEALANWERTMRQLAVERSGRLPRLRGRSLGRVAVATALGSGDDVPPRLSRALTDEGAEQFVRWSRTTLLGDLGAVLEADSRRFRDMVGEVAVMHDAGSRLASAVDRLAALPEVP